MNVTAVSFSCLVYIHIFKIYLLILNIFEVRYITFHPLKYTIQSFELSLICSLVMVVLVDLV